MGWGACKNDKEIVLSIKCEIILEENFSRYDTPLI